jgi:hypothetical protein
LPGLLCVLANLFGLRVVGLTANETMAVKDYYLKMLAAQAPSTTPIPSMVTDMPDGKPQLAPGLLFYCF